MKKKRGRSPSSKKSIDTKKFKEKETPRKAKTRA